MSPVRRFLVRAALALLLVLSALPSTLGPNRAAPTARVVRPTPTPAATLAPAATPSVAQPDAGPTPLSLDVAVGQMMAASFGGPSITDGLRHLILDAQLQKPARNPFRARNETLGPLLALAHVDDNGAVFRRDHFLHVVDGDFLDLAFDALPQVESAVLRAFRSSAAREPPELILTGAAGREAPPILRVSSLVMRAKLYGFQFELEDGILQALKGKGNGISEVMNEIHFHGVTP